MNTVSAEEITRRSQSNLAFAFATLPKERRQDMTTFYAFCRVVDDIVDDEATAESEKRPALDRWRFGLAQGFADPSPLERAISELRARREIPVELLHHVLDGMEMDIEPRRYETFEDLRQYCFRVAGAVGLVCVRILGCEDPRRDEYGENLGYCLQLTNIIRDVGEDWERGRIYLPRDEMARHGISGESFGRQTDAFRRLMLEQYERARRYHEMAGSLVARTDKKRLIAMESMRQIYARILEKIRKDDFRVFERRYRLGKWEKVAILTRQTLVGLLP